MTPTLGGWCSVRLSYQGFPVNMLSDAHVPIACLIGTFPVHRRAHCVPVWCPRQGSNLRPPPYQGGALPAELHGRVSGAKRGRASMEMAPPAGFEPATLGLEGRCPVQLSQGGVRWGLSWVVAGAGIEPATFAL